MPRRYVSAGVADTSRSSGDGVRGEQRPHDDALGADASAVANPQVDIPTLLALYKAGKLKILAVVNDTLRRSVLGGAGAGRRAPTRA